jgi:hypothetical protein
MDRDNEHRLGGTLSIAIGVLYVLLGVTFLLSPASGSQDYATVLPAFADQPVTYLLYGIVAALIGLLAIGFVPVLSKYVGSEESAFLRWMMYLALLGFAVEAVDQLRSLNLLPYLSRMYVFGDENIKSAVLASQPLRFIDTLCIFRFGFVGLWIAVVNIHGLRSGKLNRVLAVIGILGSTLLVMTMIGNLSASFIVMVVGAVAAIVVAPIWYIWTGVSLLRGKA